MRWWMEREGRGGCAWACVYGVWCAWAALQRGERAGEGGGRGRRTNKHRTLLSPPLLPPSPSSRGYSKKTQLLTHAHTYIYIPPHTNAHERALASSFLFFPLCGLPWRTLCVYVCMCMCMYACICSDMMLLYVVRLLLLPPGVCV